jgi:two-component system sensor histidine kinase KdpD
LANALNPFLVDNGLVSDTPAENPEPTKGLADLVHHVGSTAQTLEELKQAALGGRLSPTPEEREPGLVAPAGRFRVYLGAAAGVGKTYAMLNEGFRRAQRGTDVVVGFVETHGRAQTAEQIRGLEIVPRKKVEYRGAVFEEMDLDAVLARRPQVVLVDELAHTNVPGSGGHEKRWQDVLELLDQGISVITTVNVQHLESLADAVEQMTGVPIRERVPDWVVKKADQIELVDSSPEQLRRRMLHGNIYPPDRVQEALTNFFTPENLTALRELALRFVADETEEEMLEYLRKRNAKQIWETRERILAAVGGRGGDHVLRRAARMAARSKGELLVLHVGAADLSNPDRGQLGELRQLTSDVGGVWSEVNAEDPAQAIVSFAKDHQVTQIVLGSSKRKRFEELMRGSVIQKVLRAAADAGIDVHVIARSVPQDEDLSSRSDGVAANKDLGRPRVAAEGG